MDASNISGKTLDESICMAIVIYCGMTDKMNYKFKNFDPNKWKFYEGYLHLRKIPKFDSSSISSLSSANSSATNSDNNTQVESQSSRGSGQGQKKAKLAKVKQAVGNWKCAREEERDAQLKGMLSEMEDIFKTMKKEANATIVKKNTQAYY